MTVEGLGGCSSEAVVEKRHIGEIEPALEQAMNQIARAWQAVEKEVARTCSPRFHQLEAGAT